MVTTLAESGLSSGNKTKRLQVLLWGPPGSWKTVMAHGMPNTRTIDFDDGMQSVEWAILEGVIDKSLDEIVYETMLPSGGKRDLLNLLDEATDRIDAWISEEEIPSEDWEDHCRTEHGVLYPQMWDTLIIDSASGLGEASIVKGLDENRRLNLSKSWESWIESGWRVRPMRVQDWGSGAYLQYKFIEQCRSHGKNVVVIAHEYNTTDDNGTIISIDPLMIGQNRQQVPKAFDEVWYAHITGTRLKPEGKIQTTIGNKKRCGTRLGCLEPLDVLDYNALREKVAAFYKINPKDLWTAKATEEEAIEVI